MINGLNVVFAVKARMPALDAKDWRSKLKITHG
jgi:hypothetical protein